MKVTNVDHLISLTKIIDTKVIVRSESLRQIIESTYKHPVKLRRKGNNLVITFNREELLLIDSIGHITVIGNIQLLKKIVNDYNSITI